MRKVSAMVLCVVLFPTLCLAQSVAAQANALNGTEWGMSDFPGISLGFYDDTVYFCTSAKKLAFPHSFLIDLFVLKLFFAYDSEIRVSGVANMLGDTRGTAVLCSPEGCARSPISKLNDSFLPPEQ